MIIKGKQQLYVGLLILQYCQKQMSFSERLKAIENLIYDDSQKCIRTISCRKFINSLFYQQLKSFAQMFEQVLTKKGVHTKGISEGRNLLRPQLVVAFYSIIIMRANMVCIRQSTIASVATKADQFQDIIYNSKMAVEHLSKIYRSLEEGDKIRFAIVGLLLKVKGFNNYKMIAKDLHPDFVSEQTLDAHFQALKSQCPNLLEAQIIKHKQKWSKYLKFKTISMAAFEELVNQANQVERSEDLAKWDGLMEGYEVESQYLINRLNHMENSEEIEKVNIDDLINSFDQIYAKLMEKLKENSINPKKANKVEVLTPEYDYKQFVLRNYIKIFGYLLLVLNKTIHTFHINWIRKIKWLYNFIVSSFANFNIKTTVFHASVALEYSRVITLLVQIILSYLITFKNGLFPTGKLQEFAFIEEFSIYKLVQALLYNDYPFEQSDAIIFQNYQKQRKTGDNKHKQHIIDIVNFSMNSLNINPHWDSLLVKLIPNLKHSHLFARDLIHTALYFLLQYFKITHDYQHAPKLLLMLANAKNTFLSGDRRIRKVIEEIKHLIYPGKESVKEGIQYFCEEYFNEYIKVNLKKKHVSPQEADKAERLEYFETSNGHAHPSQANNTFRKTQSRDAIIQGWSQNFESVRDSPIQEIKASSSKNPMNQSAEVLNNEIFYSVKDTPKDEVPPVPLPDIISPHDEGEILLPEF